VKVPFLDLAADHALVADDALGRIASVLDSQSFVLGRQTDALEHTLAELTTASHAVACSSGSDALYLALLAADIGPGDAVAVPAFTFFATAGAVARAGARPVFLDVDSRTLCLDPSQLRAGGSPRLREVDGGLVEAASSAPVKAIVPVHLYGRACAMRAIDDALATLRRQPIVIEDAAQAIGARGDVAPVGVWGRLACFSFYPTKNLGGAGDGGALTTNDAKLADRLSRLRIHGAAPGSYLHEECGINARLGELQAAYLNSKFVHLTAWTERRRDIAAAYLQRLAPLADAGLVSLPPVAEPGFDVHHQFTIRVAGARRDEVQIELARLGVDTRVFYPVPLHLQPCFAYLGYAAGELPQCEDAAATVLSLPIHPTLTDDQLEHVCSAFAEAFGRRP
jgi:dTDP-4-amino-4,6-dideoxygalactose transaminase